MDTTQINLLLKTLGVHTSTENGNGWITCSCPLAPFTHKSGKDSHPSFGITIAPGARSNFNCYTCISGSLETLIGTLEMHLKQRPEMAARYDLKAARDVLAGEEIVVQALPEYEEFTHNAQAAFEAWPEWWLDGLPHVSRVSIASDYLSMRGVPESVQLERDLRWDSSRAMIVCPYRNLWGKLAGARGRCIMPSRGLQHYDYTWNKVNNADLIWYGEEVMTAMDGPLIIVEGQFDRMHVQQVYPKVVAGLSAKVALPKQRRLVSNEQVLFMLDNDPAGRHGTEKMLEYLNSWDVQTGVILYPEHYKDPDSIPLPELAEILESLTNLA